MQNDSPTHEKTLNKKDDTRGKTMTIPRADDEEEIGKGNDLIEDSATGSKDAVDASQQIVLAHSNKKLSICVCVFFPAR